MPALPKFAAPAHGHDHDAEAATGQSAVAAAGQADASHARHHLHGEHSNRHHAHSHHGHAHAPGERHPMAAPGFSLLRLSIWQRLAIALPLTVVLWAAAIAVISGGGL